jgi:hypothetical protein
MPTRAIETRFAGCVFRSRAEARWAAFFDALGVEWQYEPEGFDLSPTRRYLPDFELPGVGGGVYLEVKGRQPTEAESRRCSDLAEQSGKRVLLAIRAPLPPSVLAGTDNDSLHCYFPSGQTDARFAFFECPNCSLIEVAWENWTHGCWCLGSAAGAHSTPRIMSAYVAARSHRFGT